MLEGANMSIELRDWFCALKLVLLGWVSAIPQIWISTLNFRESFSFENNQSDQHIGLRLSSNGYDWPDKFPPFPLSSRTGHLTPNYLSFRETLHLVHFAQSQHQISSAGIHVRFLENIRSHSKNPSWRLMFRSSFLEFSYLAVEFGTVPCSN